MSNPVPRLKEDVHVAPKKERRERDKRRRENRGGRKRERPQTIQSHSIFEQGPADSVCKTGAKRLQFSFVISGSKAHQWFTYSCTSSLPTYCSLCSGWRSATHLHDPTTPPVCDLVKKEWKESEDGEDEILSKLQRDDVSTSCYLLYVTGFTNGAKPIKNMLLVIANGETPTLTRKWSNHSRNKAQTFVFIMLAHMNTESVFFLLYRLLSLILVSLSNVLLVQVMVYKIYSPLSVKCI